MIKIIDPFCWMLGIKRFDKTQYRKYYVHLSTGFTLALHDEIKRNNAVDAWICWNDFYFDVSYRDVAGKHIAGQRIARKYIVYREGAV